MELPLVPALHACITRKDNENSLLSHPVHRDRVSSEGLHLSPLTLIYSARIEPSLGCSGTLLLSQGGAP